MFLKLLLFPFSVLYDLVTRIRNHQYDTDQKKSIKFEIPVISVGNLTVGGTGKTPHVYLLAKLFSNKFKKIPGIVSRGYGRKSKGFFLATPYSSSTQIGDEPLQLYNALGRNVPVAVCEERILGIPSLLLEEPDINLILLDDAFQHRKVKADLNILLSDFNRPFYKDFLLPSGRLREARKGASRADLVIVTKVPEKFSIEDTGQIENQVSKYTNAPVFFSRYTYGEPVLFSGNEVDNISKIILVSGIAHTAYLLKYIDQTFNLLKHLAYTDHAKYTTKDIAQIATLFEKYSSEENTVVLTTEKDKTKLAELLTDKNKVPYYYLPIESEILFNNDKFENIIGEKIFS